jgi:hypothetical protein
MRYWLSGYGLGKDISQILRNQEAIMAMLDDLQVKIAELQAAVDADQASDAQVIRDLQDQVDLLTGELAAGATAAQLADVVTALEGIIVDVSGPNE